VICDIAGIGYQVYCVPEVPTALLNGGVAKNTHHTQTHPTRWARLRENVRTFVSCVRDARAHALPLPLVFLSLSLPP